MRRVWLSLPLLLCSAHAHAAALPMNITVTDSTGHARSLADHLGGHPAFVLFADYTCKNLCGPALVLLGSALQQSHLTPAEYRMVVIGIDPKDRAGDAMRMADAQLPQPTRRSATLLLPDASSLAAITAALDFHYRYDSATDQFVHPEVVYAVAADGNVTRRLSPLTLTSKDVETAFSARARDEGPSGAFGVLCHQLLDFTAIHGRTIGLLLQASAALTLACMGGAFFFFMRRRRAA